MVEKTFTFIISLKKKKSLRKKKKKKIKWSGYHFPSVQANPPPPRPLGKIPPLFLYVMCICLHNNGGNISMQN
jgi:hypothetical protein